MLAVAMLAWAPMAQAQFFWSPLFQEQPKRQKAARPSKPKPPADDLPPIVPKESSIPPPPDDRPYDAKLLRLAEILGAVHYLRELCGAQEGQLWREQMKEIVKNEGSHHPGWTSTSAAARRSAKLLRLTQPRSSKPCPSSTNDERGTSSTCLHENGGTARGSKTRDREIELADLCEVEFVHVARIDDHQRIVRDGEFRANVPSAPLRHEDRFVETRPDNDAGHACRLPLEKPLDHDRQPRCAGDDMVLPRSADGRLVVLEMQQIRAAGDADSRGSHCQYTRAWREGMNELRATTVREDRKPHSCVPV